MVHGDRTPAGLKRGGGVPVSHAKLGCATGGGEGRVLALSHAKLPETDRASYPRRLGSHVLVRELGRGGMGLVELALSPRSYRPCVLKRMLPDARAHRGEERFRREVKILSELEHPSIARALNVFELPDTGPVLVQEFIYGRNLKQVWDLVAAAGERLPVEFAVGVVIEACDALDVAFRTVGLVHRDLAPQNLMLSFAGELKLIDFGVAKTEFDESLTLPGQLIGRRSYLAPEVLIGAPWNHVSDLFSLGAILWELLAGRSVATVTGAARAQWPPPSSLNPQVSPALDRVALRALSWRSADRFQTAAQLREALEPYAKREGRAAERRRFLRKRYDVDRDVRRLRADLDQAASWARASGAGRGRGGGREGSKPRRPDGRPSRSGIVILLGLAAAVMLTVFVVALRAL